MDNFKIGDQVQIDLSLPMNKDNDFFHEYLKTHENVFTIVGSDDPIIRKSTLLYFKEHEGGLFAARFKPIKCAKIAVTEKDLEGLLNG